MTNYSKARDEYLESEVLSAGPVRRVQLLYEGAIESICQARAALAAKDIPARTKKVNKALDILSELSISLNHDGGAPVSRQLVELYDYAQRCLIDGNANQADEPLANAEQVLKTVLEAWSSIPEVVPSSIASRSNHQVPADYGSGDSFAVRSVGSGLDQLG